MSSTKWLKISAIIARIKKYNPIIEKNKKSHDEIVMLDCKKRLISSCLTVISLTVIYWVQVLRKYDDMKKKINNRETSWLN